MRCTAVETIHTARTMVPVHMVGPGETSLPIHDNILANVRVKADNTQQPRVNSSTLAGRVFEVDWEEEKLD